MTFDKRTRCLGVLYLPDLHDSRDPSTVTLSICKAGPLLEIFKENELEYFYLVLAERIVIFGKVKCTCIISQILEEPGLLIPMCSYGKLSAGSLGKTLMAHERSKKINTKLKNKVYNRKLFVSMLVK